MLEVKCTDNGDSQIIELDGELNVKTTADFEKTFSKLDGKKVILDVSKLDYISSAGLRSLVILIKKLYASKGELVLSGLTGVVREIIDVSGFENLFKIFDTVKEAESYFNS